MTKLNALTVEPTQTADSAMIICHGLGADGSDFLPVAESLATSLPGMRFILPNAPLQAVTINAGMSMPAWYDILAIDLHAEQDAEGIKQSAFAIEQLIAEQEANHIAPNRIILAGFSQGGAMALHIGLRRQQLLAGIVVLSSYLPLHETVKEEIGDVGNQIPIFMAHGQFDPVVPPFLGTLSRDKLQSHGCQVDWHEYPMLHQVCPEEIEDLRQWLIAKLA